MGSCFCKPRRAIVWAAMVGFGSWAGICRGSPLVPYMGPTGGPGVTYGVPQSASPGMMSIGGGTSVGRYDTFNLTGTYLGTRALRWDAGGAVVSMGTLGTATNGRTDESVGSVTPTGQLIGWAEKYSGAGVDLGPRVVRWDAAGGVTAELPAPFVLPSGYASAMSTRANAAGVVVGTTAKFIGSTSVGSRPVRWAADGTATVLGDLGTSSSGYTEGTATGINNAGTIVGNAVSHVQNPNGSFRAVRWSAGSTTPVELGNLGTDASGITDVRTGDINASGIAIGSALRYVGNTSRGRRAVIWLPGQTAAMELGNFGTGTDSLYGADYTESGVVGISDAGEMVGWCRKYGVSDPPTSNNYVNVATAWDATGAVHELQALTTLTGSFRHSGAADVNESGIVVGQAFDPYSRVSRAVYWNPDGTVVDLNSLIDPSGSGPWELTTAETISDDGWITGQAVYRPNGPFSTGNLVEYTLQLPEPTGVAGIGMVVVVLMKRRRGA
jgi:hypothetical protein